MGKVGHKTGESFGPPVYKLNLFFFPTRKRHTAAAGGDDVAVLRDYSAAVGRGGERAAPRVVVRIAAAADADRRRGGALRVHGGMSLQ